MASESCRLAGKNNINFFLFCENSGDFMLQIHVNMWHVTSWKKGRATKFKKKDKNKFDKLYAWKMPILG